MHAVGSASWHLPVVGQSFVNIVDDKELVKNITFGRAVSGSE